MNGTQTSCFNRYFLSPCSVNGECVNATCICHPGYTGATFTVDASTVDCLADLNTINIVLAVTIAFTLFSAIISAILLSRFRPLVFWPLKMLTIPQWYGCELIVFELLLVIKLLLVLFGLTMRNYPTMVVALLVKIFGLYRQITITSTYLCVFDKIPEFRVTSVRIYFVLKCMVGFSCAWMPACYVLMAQNELFYQVLGIRLGFGVFSMLMLLQISLWLIYGRRCVDIVEMSLTESSCTKESKQSLFSLKFFVYFYVVGCLVIFVLSVMVVLFIDSWWYYLLILQSLMTASFGPYRLLNVVVQQKKKRIAMTKSNNNNMMLSN